MATNSAASREARRRKILERGADRLALITGRTETLPSESHNDSNSDQLLRLQDPPPQPPPSQLSDQITAFPDGGDRGFSSILPSNDPIIDAGNIEPPSHRHEKTMESSRASASDGDSNERSLLALSIDETSNMSASGTVQNLDPQRRPNRFFTPSQISSAIATSERYRLFCSVTIALFVVLSYLGFPLLGGNMIKSIVSFRPLYLVLLTNLTLVLARLLFNNQRGFERVGGRESTIPSMNKNDWADQAGRVLEVGLVIQKAIEAVFMDCSVYVLIVTAGFSFVR
ncbi:hypothetical protein JCGZ_07801 [Jatropha curcas]|uniref:Transmembrane protein n=1 Tax=Jatropha curcas TaxID=180498 RepID=A0A067KPP0_JATCU|nr:uncharacterized protein LOC105638286 [Jatropha curcas]KDP34230.1 hypothetical protein JCGZ_07801 [Jatropha curcas]